MNYNWDLDYLEYKIEEIGKEQEISEGIKIIFREALNIIKSKDDSKEDLIENIYTIYDDTNEDIEQILVDKDKCNTNELNKKDLIRVVDKYEGAIEKILQYLDE